MNGDRVKRLALSVVVPACVASILVTTSGAGGAPPAAADARTAAITGRRAIRANEVAWLRDHAGPDHTVRVIVELAAPSIAQAEGDAADAGTPFTEAESAAVVAAATSAQNEVTGAVAAEGGTVTASTVHAVTTVTATVPASGLEALAADPNVVDIAPVKLYRRDNGVSNAYTGVPNAWQYLGATGAGQTIAVIDTGVDYTHADFGGSGDPADFADNDTTVIEPGSFPTAKVIGGYDFVGDAYDASSTDPATSTPQPDPDPLGCAPGGTHGTHVAGTAAGEGVLLDGSTFTGPYDATIDPSQFLVSPGSAPQASLLAYRVFGCDGFVGSDVIVAAIDRAVADGADVINMSLGSDLGEADGPEQAAVDNASRAGVVVVTSAGNSGHSAYFVGGPSTADRAISVAAMDAYQQFPSATISNGAGTDLAAINANASTALPIDGTLVVVPDGLGGISLGCQPTDYPPPTAPNTVYVVLRGVCDRVAKPALAQAAGGVGLIMVNNSANYPPFEGPIVGVTIPFLGVPPEAGAVLQSIDGSAITVTDAGVMPNPGYTLPADFTSGGPRSGDGAQKPDVSAPGLSVMSAALGTGTQAAEMSGTSMASPHIAGIAALVLQMHPKWSADMVKAAIVDTADGDRLGDFDTRVSGNGVADALGAVSVDTVMVTTHGQVAVNFGFQELDGAYHDTKTVTIRNAGPTPAGYDLAPVWNSDPMGAAVSVQPSHVTVPPWSSKTVNVTLRLSKQAVAALPDADQGTNTVVSLRGQIVATPRTDDQPISIAFMMVPHSRSNVEAKTSWMKLSHNGHRYGSISLKNSGVHAGTADVYTWLLGDGNDPSLAADARALGVQYLPDADPDGHPGEPLMVFAFNEFDRFSAPTADYYHMALDTDMNGNVDHEIFVIDQGVLENPDGTPNGIMNTYVLDEDFNGWVYGADVPVDGSVALGFAFPSDLGIGPNSGPAALIADVNSYTTGTADPIDGYATINPFHPQASSGDYIAMDPGSRTTFAVDARRAHNDEAPVKGWMIVTVDDHSGAPQADLVHT